jgi:hypothetical protein
MKISPDPKEIEIRRKRHSISFEILNKNVQFVFPCNPFRIKTKIENPQKGGVLVAFARGLRVKLRIDKGNFVRHTRLNFITDPIQILLRYRGDANAVNKEYCHCNNAKTIEQTDKPFF